jgi:CDP-diacylglycerol---glycerol-3-phosphate 3-phosphatidyltransferase
MIMTGPNIISLVRVVIAPIFLVLMLSGNPEEIKVAAWLFVIGALSDYFDGWLARRYNEVTSLGKFLDPLADKILTIAAFTSFYLIDLIPLWMLLVIAVRDIASTVLRVLADNIDKPVVTSNPAKAKTFLQMTFIIYILILLYIINSGLIAKDVAIVMDLMYSDLTYYTALIITSFTMWTLIDYFFNNKVIFSHYFGKNKK